MPILFLSFSQKIKSSTQIKYYTLKIRRKENEIEPKTKNATNRMNQLRLN